MEEADKLRLKIESLNVAQQVRFAAAIAIVAASNSKLEHGQFLDITKTAMDLYSYSRTIELFEILDGIPERGLGRALDKMLDMLHEKGAQTLDRFVNLTELLEESKQC